MNTVYIYTVCTIAMNGLYHVRIHIWHSFYVCADKVRNYILHFCERVRSAHRKVKVKNSAFFRREKFIETTTTTAVAAKPERLHHRENAMCTTTHTVGFTYAMNHANICERPKDSMKTSIYCDLIHIGVQHRINIYGKIIQIPTECKSTRTHTHSHTRKKVDTQHMHTC